MIANKPPHIFRDIIIDYNKTLIQSGRLTDKEINRRTGKTEFIIASAIAFASNDLKVLIVVQNRSLATLADRRLEKISNNINIDISSVNKINKNIIVSSISAPGTSVFHCINPDVVLADEVSIDKLGFCR